MSEQNKKLVLTGGISFNDFKDTKPSNLENQNSNSDTEGFTPIKGLFSDNTDKLQDNDTKNIQINLDLINRLEYLIDNLEIEIEYKSNTDYIFDELIEIEKEHLKLLNERKEKPSIVEERRKNIERLKEEKKNARQEQIKLHNLASSQNRNISSISKINKKRRSNYVDFGKNKGQEISIPMGKSLKQSILDDNYKEKTKIIQRADAIYGSDEEYFKKFKPNKKVIKPEIIKPERREEDIPNITNAEKMFFPNGTLADMPLAQTIKNNINKELEKEKDALFESLKNKKIGETDVKLDDIIPNLETYAQKNMHSKNAEDLFYPSMRKASELETDIQLFEKGLIETCKLITKKEKFKKTINVDKKIEIFLNDLKHYTQNINTLFNELGVEKTNELLRLYLKGGNSSLFGAEKLVGKDAANLLRLSKKNAKLYTPYTENAKKYNSINELPEKYKKVIREKLISQNLPINSRGLIFTANSEPSKRVTESKDFKDLILSNLDNIKEKQINTSIEFKKSSNENLYYSYHYADIMNLRIDKKGDIYGDLIDTTDYNKGDENILVKAARPLQLSGEITPIFVIVQFKTNIKELTKESDDN